MGASQPHSSTAKNTVAESFTSSTRPIINDQLSTTGQLSTTATMSDTNGKAPINGAGSPARHSEPLVKVQPPRREDLQPSYARVIQPDDQDADTNGWYGAMINTLGGCIGTLGAIPCCVVCPNPYKPVSQGNVGLVTKFGRFARAVDPGLVYVNPLSEQLVQVDIKIQIVEVPKQVCMTKDNVTLNLTSVIYYRITSPHKAAFSISNIRQALVERTQTTLRHVIGARVLQDVIERREEIALSIREIIEETALGWGVEVESMLVKDIIFSQELQESLSMAAQSKRTGEAKVIAARAEVESAKVIFLPAQNQTVQSALAQADAAGEGPSSYMPKSNQGNTSLGTQSSAAQEYGGNDNSFQSAINSHVIENM
ncbi:hypothetical protein HBI56_032890 [Parastagonospora nodorum]|nr:hypothetical protein HBH56_020690 [Parastagonospora nodorum]KAH3944175.1 hypothetical protein HBH53_162940 [Parastagonospora nodorum]KAH4137381.1 hypothetical protein HBH45_126990 [Parastagonospora nodorum]KAH4205625.1 hypothetical protein HBI95_129270 [Parastagonospora nodorum]KAH4234452.1 hypothetical protein HBI05_151340 [Parastagonospora nodorum]